MKLFIDCEWNSYKGELISMALVPEIGEAWYKEFKTTKEIDSWVQQNVIPKLKGFQVGRKIAQDSLQKYLLQFEAIHLIADWPEDIERFCELLIVGPGLRLDTPPLTMEVVRIDAKSDNPHNALADAMGLKNAYLG